MSSSAAALPVVYLVDDEEVVRDAIGWLLRSRRLLSEGYASAEEFEAMLERVVRAPGDHSSSWPRSPCCLLLDLRMGGKSGLSLFERLVECKLIREMPVIFLTGHGDVPTAVAAVKRGAFDFVEKPFSNNALVDRIQEALRASAEALAARAEQTTLATRLADLSVREREVMALVTQGLANKAIADRLNVSIRTVETHRANLFDKLEVRSAVELVNRYGELRMPSQAGRPT